MAFARGAAERFRGLCGAKRINGRPWASNVQRLLAPYLMAPVMEPGARERSVVLPAGCAWRNVDTGEIWVGGQRAAIPALLDVIPVLERLEA